MWVIESFSYEVHTLEIIEQKKREEIVFGIKECIWGGKSNNNNKPMTMMK